MFLAAATAGGNSMFTFVAFAGMIVLMYFTMIRPQKKQQEQRQQMMSKMKRGDRVVTIGGLHGVIDSINDEDKTVTLDCDGVYLVFNLNAIARVLEPVANDDQEVASSTQEASDTVVEKEETEK